MDDKTSLMLKGAALVMLAVCLWSVNPIIARYLADKIGPFTVTMLRNLISALVILPLALPYWRKAMPIVRCHWAYFFITGFLGIGAANAMLYLSAHTTSAINIGLLFAISPVITLILARIFSNEPLTWRRVAGILLCIIGAVCLLSRGQMQVVLNIEFYPGDLVAVIGSSLFAIYTFMVRRQPSGVSLPFFLFIMFCCGFVGLIPFSLWEIATDVTMIFDKVTVALLLYLSIGVSVTAYLGWNLAIRYIGPVHTMIIYYSCPILTTIAAILILKESITTPLAIGSGLIMGGVALATLGNAARHFRRSRRFGQH
ncbi:MAG: DMT family transporter [Desulfarculales bacterium]|jgi:drug/metabolite transporter (DMT)-like permease|nr:DMT family transporter [Desulfarculales bacterium]